MPYSITREDGTADAMALQDALNVLKASSGWDSPTAERLRELRDSIEEQVKPAVEEPTEFGSIVRAGYDANTDRVLWVRTARGWYAETRHGFHAYFAGLHEPEVLRIGVGGTWRQGFDDCALHLRKQLIQLRSSAITAERQDAYDKAIEAVEALS